MAKQINEVRDELIHSYTMQVSGKGFNASINYNISNEKGYWQIYVEYQDTGCYNKINKNLRIYTII